VSVAGKVLAKNLGDDDRRRLLDQAIAELPAAPNGQGGARA
jgi:F-type H+-transporting ATPase subunit b